MSRPSASGPVLRPIHAGLVLAALLAGCTVHLDDPPSGGDGDGDGDTPTVDAAPGDGDGDGDADASTGVTPEALFTSTVQPLFDENRPLGKCTACHETGTPTAGPKFLGADEEEHYATLTGSTRYVPATAADIPEGKLHTRGLHTGDAFCTGPGEPAGYCTQDEVALIVTWLEAEAAAAAQ